MSSLLRNLPVIVLAVAVGVSVYYIHKHLLNMNSKLEHMSQEIYYNIASIHDLNEKVAGKPGGGARKTPGMPAEPPVVVYASLSPEEADDVDSTESFEVHGNDPRRTSSSPIEKVQATSGLSRRSPSAEAAFEPVWQPQPKRRSPQKKSVEIKEEPADLPAAPVAANDPSVDAVQSDAEEPVADENHYIDALEDYIKKGEPRPDQDADEEEDAASDSMSTASAFNNRKKCPPYAAKQFDIGHAEIYNGKKFFVIRNSKGVIRWSRAHPLN